MLTDFQPERGKSLRLNIGVKGIVRVVDEEKPKVYGQVIERKSDNANVDRVTKKVNA